jgi:hypothetical protein
MNKQNCGGVASILHDGLAAGGGLSTPLPRLTDAKRGCLQTPCAVIIYVVFVVWAAAAVCVLCLMRKMRAVVLS